MMDQWQITVARWPGREARYRAVHTSDIVIVGPHSPVDWLPVPRGFESFYVTHPNDYSYPDIIHAILPDTIFVDRADAIFNTTSARYAFISDRDFAILKLAAT